MLLKGEAPASVQCAALRSLGQVLSAIDTVPPSDAKMFNECAMLLSALLLFVSNSAQLSLCIMRSSMLAD